MLLHKWYLITFFVCLTNGKYEEKEACVCVPLVNGWYNAHSRDSRKEEPFT